VRIFSSGFLHGQRRFGAIATHSIYRGKKDQVLSCAFPFCPFSFWEIFVERVPKKLRSVIVFGLPDHAVLVAAIACSAAIEEEGTERYDSPGFNAKNDLNNLIGFFRAR
jgi:hypothetical protein